ncbi:MAG: hypothetical protein OXR84_14790 [Magnetovibrio sp.]|nr:hypothetical protein [Magnetovibrio sp.]
MNQGEHDLRSRPVTRIRKAVIVATLTAMLAVLFYVFGLPFVLAGDAIAGNSLAVRISAFGIILVMLALVSVLVVRPLFLRACATISPGAFSDRVIWFICGTVYVVSVIFLGFDLFRNSVAS